MLIKFKILYSECFISYSLQYEDYYYNLKV
jgi:hypothetical protein